MSNIEVLKDLKDRELLKPLVTAGIIPYKVMTYLDMYYYVDAQIKNGSSKTEAVCCASVAFNICESNVWRALASLK